MNSFLFQKGSPLGHNRVYPRPYGFQNHIGLISFRVASRSKVGTPSGQPIINKSEMVGGDTGQGTKELQPNNEQKVDKIHVTPIANAM